MTSAAASHYPYSPTPSLASTASTTSSVWSVAESASSAATSTASSIGTPSARDSYTAPPTAKISSLPPPPIPGCTASHQIPAFHDHRHPHDPRPPADAQPVPLEQRQHPRRTNRLASDVPATTATAAAAAAASATTAVAPCPATEGCDDGTVPSLKRQADRKLCFVENLVGMYGQNRASRIKK